MTIRQTPMILKGKVLQRDEMTCQICYKDADHVHHIIPKRMGGLDVLENLTSVCRRCHKLIELVQFIEYNDNDSRMVRLKEDTYLHMRQYVNLDRTFDDVLREALKLPKRIK